MSDPYFSNVGLLCHFNGANNQTTTVDSSSSAKTVILTGTGPKLTTAQFKFGTASLDLSAGTNAYASLADSPDWDFGSGQFTVEAWVRPTVAISGIDVIVAQFTNPVGGNAAWELYFNNNTLNFTYTTTGFSATVTVVGAAYTPTLNTWIHVAADRDASNMLRIYADGVVIASATAAATFWNSTINLRVGNDAVATRGFVGQIDDVRITKGVARYAGAFTPPSAEFPDSAPSVSAARQYAITVIS